MTVVSFAPRQAAGLASRWQSLLADEPKLRIRDAAARLGVSELELVALECGAGAVRLGGDFGALIEDLPALGRVMALTRNESAVHERKGRFDRISIRGPMGLVLNKEIDLRLFMNHFVHGFAVETPRHDGTLRSLQFFDAAGTAVIKIYLTDDSDGAAYDALVARFTSADQSKEATTEAAPAAEAALDDADVDVAGLRAGWDQLRDVHDFVHLLRRHRATRAQSFRLVGMPYCRRVTLDGLWKLLNQAAACAMPVMVFVGNRGCIQIHSGTIETVRRIGPWANVLDPDFNLHLREDRIAEAWVVAKPTDEGIVTCLELLDPDGATIVQVFSLREPGAAESEAWRAMLSNLDDDVRP